MGVGAVALVVVVIAVAAIVGGLFATGVLRLSHPHGSPPVSDYNVSFSETGLPSSTAWSVSLSGTERTTTGDEVGFTVPNGSYSFSVAGPATCSDWSPDPSSGTVHVAGDAVRTGVTFTGTCEPTYTLEMSSPAESATGSGYYYSIAISPSSDLTTGMFGVILEESGGTAIPSAGTVPSGCAWSSSGTSYSTSSCKAPTGTGASWYAVLYWSGNDSIANVFGSSGGWTSPTLPVTSSETLVVVSATNLAGSTDTLDAYSTGSSSVSGQSGAF